MVSCCNCNKAAWLQKAGLSYCSSCYNAVYGSPAPNGYHKCVFCGVLISDTRTWDECTGCALKGRGSPSSFVNRKRGANVIKCRIFYDTTLGGYTVSSSYNEKFISGMKQVMPSGSYHYDKQTKLWHISEAYGPVIHNVAKLMFGDSAVSFTSKEVAEQARKSQQQAPPPVVGVMLNPQDTLLLTFMRLLPYEAAKTAFRTAAIAMHPDKGGAADKMAELNATWNQISREVYGK